MCYQWSNCIVARLQQLLQIKCILILGGIKSESIEVIGADDVNSSFDKASQEEELFFDAGDKIETDDHREERGVLDIGQLDDDQLDDSSVMDFTTSGININQIISL